MILQHLLIALPPLPFLLTHTATYHIFTLSLHDALPISSAEPISSSKVASDRVVMVDMEVGFLSERDGGGGGLVPLSQQRRGDRHSRRSVDQWAPDASSQRSASMAAMQPDPAAVMAWR